MFIYTEDDLDLDRIADSGQCFRWEKTGEQAYRIPAGGRCLRISARGGGRFALDCAEKEYDAFWKDYFDLGEDYRAIRARIDPEEDPFLFRAAEEEKGIRILRQDPWETLVTFIISQNKNIPAIRRSVALLAAVAGETRTDAEGVPYQVFPGPEAVAALSGDELKRCSLGYRCAYVRGAAEAVLNGSLDLAALCRMGETEALGALTGLYGVGIKVASCTALFGLHHMDAFPKDVWIRRILEAEYPGGYPEEKYRPYNGVYQQYMFAYYRKEAAGGAAAEASCSPVT